MPYVANEAWSKVNVVLDVLSNALNTRPRGDVLSIERAVDALNNPLQGERMTPQTALKPNKEGINE